MNKITSSLAAISLALSAGSALAADLPSLKAPPVVVPPPPLWTGFYFGANVGGIFDASTGATTTATPIFNDTTGAALGAPSYFGTASAASIASNASLSNAGVIGGGQIGYNWQFNNSFLAGLEADIQGTTLSSNATASGAATEPSTGSLVSTTASLTKSLGYLGTVRGRLGFLATPNSAGVRDGRPRLWRHGFHRRPFPNIVQPEFPVQRGFGRLQRCAHRLDGGRRRRMDVLRQLERQGRISLLRPRHGHRRQCAFGRRSSGQPALRLLSTRPRPILTARSSASA